MTSPLLWFANRATGLVLLVLFTVVVLLGVLSTVLPARPRRRLPSFVSQALHRSSALLSVALLGAHIGTAVLDDYVDIGWVDAVVPFAGSYKPAFLGLGTLAVDLLAAIVITALLRHRIPERWWRPVHLLSYAAWGLAVWHALGIGTDVTAPWGRWIVSACVATVVAAVVVRVAVRPGASSSGDSSAATAAVGARR